MPEFVAGQRWISESEPELGLATVVTSGEGRVQVVFPASGETRTYADDNAPLKRVRFRVGDAVRSHDGHELVVTAVEETDGLITYVGGDTTLPEAGLSDSISLHGPEDRLFAGRFDDSEDFELRRRTLEFQHQNRRSSVRGFVGGRIDLIPHQFYIAQEVSRRFAPRVMLSDEVGLGKTIEACLILHRLLLTGRAGRVLIVVPESLVHQWFVELLRRFNMWFNIFDEERCSAIESGEPGANPFLDDQLILTSIDFLVGSPKRGGQAIEADWDVLVVDEAHHLEWSPDAPGAAYQIVEGISRRAEGLLLLTATPEQLGVESHFARLRLLDPDRYSDLETFQMESRNFREVAAIAGKLLAGKKLAKKDVTLLAGIFDKVENIEGRLKEVAGGDAAERESLLADLLDMHGPGRVLFRNTRAAMTGFPKRTVQLVQLGAGAAEDDWLDKVSTEFAVDAGDSSLEPEFEMERDPRILWLVQLLKDLDPAKVLLICRSIEKVEAIDEALRRHLNIKVGVFHEGLTLVQRDRNAAWFAETDGARLLICSEIGSEGRNFQFAHHLVLFDLPLNPELLEQRIGRLDRIGQTEDIQIHVPFLEHSPQEVLARWYHEGLDAFETNLEGAGELLKTFGRAVHDLALEYPVADRKEAEKELRSLLKRTGSARKEIRQLLEQGRDRLLEMNSFRPAVATAVIDQIQARDQSPDLEEYMLDVFDHFGVRVEELDRHTWQLNPQGIITDSFPSIPDEGMIVTSERRGAIRREDVGFLTWDHPMVSGAMDLLLGSEKGNCAFAVQPTEEERTLLIELVFLLETMAAPRLHVDRFLPATPIRLVLNHKPADVTAAHSGAAWSGGLKKGPPYKLVDNPDISRRLIPAMLKRGAELAEKKAATLRSQAGVELRKLLGHEVQRLEELARINDHVRPEEIELAKEQLRALDDAIGQSRVRLDSLRLIWKGPMEALD